MTTEIRELLELWRETVGSVERGYELALEDYENGLSNRERIERLIPNADAGILRATDRLDERFLAATTQARRAVWLTEEWWTGCDRDAPPGAGTTRNARVKAMMSRLPRLLRSPFFEDFRALAEEPDLIERVR